MYLSTIYIYNIGQYLKRVKGYSDRKCQRMILYMYRQYMIERVQNKPFIFEKSKNRDIHDNIERQTWLSRISCADFNGFALFLLFRFLAISSPLM